MLQARLGWLRDYPTLTHVVASASARASGFFQKQGFEIYNTHEGYFGQGHDLHDMKLRLR
jgi:ribosomal protein S18 acetylase RimI-like enzyme